MRAQRELFIYTFLLTIVTMLVVVVLDARRTFEEKAAAVRDPAGLYHLLALDTPPMTERGSFFLIQTSRSMPTKNSEAAIQGSHSSCLRRVASSSAFRSA